MEPYEYINHMVIDAIRDCYPVDAEYYCFDDNIRWNGFEDVNINISYTLFSETGVRISPSFLDHSWEPVLSTLDQALWDVEHHKPYFLPGARRTNAAGEPLGMVHPSKYPLIAIHSEQQSDDVAQIQAWGWRTVHWFSHAYLCSEFYFRHYSKLPFIRDYTARPIRHAWICANRLLRKHRTDFLELLDLSQGCYSLMNPDPLGAVYTGPVPARSFDTHTNSSAEIELRQLNDWNTSFLHIVTETVWQDKIHFTEKVFKPVVLHQPFVVLQAPGSLLYLHRYGFRTFEDWWDESYDLIEDPVQRMQAIADIVNDIGSRTLEELETMRVEMAGVLEHNYRHFYENIPAICLNELREGIATL